MYIAIGINWRKKCPPKPACFCCMIDRGDERRNGLVLIFPIDTLGSTSKQTCILKVTVCW